jgi:hypothetical protein
VSVQGQRTAADRLVLRTTAPGYSLHASRPSAAQTKQTKRPARHPQNLRQVPQPPHTNRKTLCHKTRETTQIPVPGPLTGPLNRPQPAYPHGMPCQGKSYVNVKVRRWWRCACRCCAPR